MTTGAHFGSEPPAAGDAGNTFLTGLLDVPLDEAGARQLNAGAQQFKSLAENGGFAINQAGFDAYTKVCDQFIHEFDEIFHDVKLLARAPGMGSSPYAKEVADFNAKVASDGGQSLIPNLELLKQGFIQVREALAIARKNYSETEDAHSQTFAKLRGSE
jgi:hypothetical protein